MNEQGALLLDGAAFDDPGGWAIQNMLTVARLMIAAASERTESRGVHSRADFPATDLDCQTHITMQAGQPRPARS